MPNNQCKVCGRLDSNNHKVNSYEYCVIEWGDVCPKCASTLGRSLTLIANALKGKHYHERMRYVDDLIYKLNLKGFPPWRDNE